MTCSMPGLHADLRDLMQKHFAPDDGKAAEVAADVWAVLERRCESGTTTAGGGAGADERSTTGGEGEHDRVNDGESSWEPGEHPLNPRADDDEEIRVMWVDEVYRSPRLLDSRDTMARACCGKRAAKLAFVAFKHFPMVLSGVWAVGTLLGLLAFMGVLPTTWCYCAALTLPLVFLNYASMQRQLFRKLMTMSFETVFLSTLLLLWGGAMLDVVLLDAARLFCLFAFVANFAQVLLTDAMFRAGRNFHVVMVVCQCAAVLILVTIAVTSQLGIMPNIRNRKIPLSLGSIEVEVNVLFFANSRAFTLILFMCKNIVNLVCRPHAFIVIRALVESKKLKKKNLRQTFSRRQSVRLLEEFESGSFARSSKAIVKRALRVVAQKARKSTRKVLPKSRS